MTSLPASESPFDKSPDLPVILGGKIQELDTEAGIVAGVPDDDRAGDEAGRLGKFEAQREDAACRVTLSGFDEGAALAQIAKGLIRPCEDPVLAEPDFSFEGQAGKFPFLVRLHKLRSRFICLGCCSYSR